MPDERKKPDTRERLREILRIFGEGCSIAGKGSVEGGNPADCDKCLEAAVDAIENTFCKTPK